MIKVISVSIGGFRNIKSTKILFSNITTLLADNNYGKTNVIDALKFAFEYIGNVPKGRVEMMKWAKGIPMNSKLLEEPFHFEIEIENDMLPKHRYIKYGFKFDWLNKNSNVVVDGRITDEYIETRATTSVKYTSFLKRDLGRYRQGKGTTSFKKIRLDDNVLSIDILEFQFDEEISHVAKIIKNVKMSVCGFDDSVEVFNKSFNGIDEIETRLLWNIIIPQIIFDLRETDNKRYSLLLESIYDLFPEIISMEVKSAKITDKSTDVIRVGDFGESIVMDSEVSLIPYNGMYRLMVKSRHLNHPVDISRMSFGTKRIIWFLVSLFTAKSKGVSIIAIEGLEASVHPKIFRGLLEIVSSLSKEVSIIITSYSPLIIQYLKPESLYIGKRNQEGYATFSAIEYKKVAQIRHVSMKMGMSFGEYIFDALVDDLNGPSIIDAILEDNDD